jgi:alpha-glucosidase
MSSKKIYDGGKWILVDAPLSMIPLFVREGGVVPMQEAQQYVGEKKITETEVLIYPSDGSRYSLFEDDGISFDHEKGEYSVTTFDCRKYGKDLQIRIGKEKDGYTTGRKDYLFKIISQTKPRRVLVGGEPLFAVNSPDELKGKSAGYYYNREEKIVYVKAADRGTFAIAVESGVHH